MHQVELQLQNEQLTETCLELAMLRDRYQTLSTTIATSFLYLQDPQRGSVAGVVLLAMSLVVVVVSAVLARRLRAAA